MPSQEKPGAVGYFILSVAICGIVLLATGIGTNHWIKIYGSDAAKKADAKFYAMTNKSIDEYTILWPVLQGQYNQLASQYPILMGVLVSAKTNLTQLMTAAAAAAGRKKRSSSAIQALQLQLQTTGAALKQVGTGMGMLKALNATKNAFVPMHKMDLCGGFFSMCSHDGTKYICGPASKFRNTSLDEPCKPDYKSNATGIPTVESILAKTSSCNANGLAKVVAGTVGFFGAVIMAATALSLLPTALMAINTFKPQARNTLFNGVTIGIMYLVCGALVVGMSVFYQIKIIGAYHDSDMHGTRTSYSWILAIIGGSLFCVAGIISFLLRPKGEVAPN
uniref:Uncharacterized protein n=1 Tax=Ciona savignyi TaxID=51511 RepID=H2Z2F2_CIOSA